MHIAHYSCQKKKNPAHFARQVIMKIKSATSIDIQCNITKHR